MEAQGQLSKNFNVKLRLFSYPSVKTYVLGAQKNRLIEMVLLSTHNISFGWDIRKNFQLRTLSLIWGPGLHLCCSHAPKSDFLTTRPDLIITLVIYAQLIQLAYLA